MEVESCHWEVVSGLAHDKRRVDGNLCALRGRREHPNNFFVLARGHWEVVSGLAHDKRRVDGNLCALRGRRALPGGRASHPGGGQANNKKPPSVRRTVY